MDLGLSDRVYVVAGASAGLGRACALQLVAEGARLVLCGRDETGLAETAAMAGGPGRAIAVSGDLSAPGLETCLSAAAIARYGRLDGALIGLGLPEPGPFTQIGDERWRLAFESNLLAPLRLARSVSGNVSTEGGSVLFLLGPGAREAQRDHVLANGLLPGVAMTAKAMADELGPANVRVNVLLAGHLDTERTRARDGAGEEEDQRRTRERIPLGRYGDPWELARPAVFLLSPAASYVTGSALAVDGGLARAV